MTETEPIEVDCRAMLCPVPVIRLGLALHGTPPGTLVALLADDPAAVTDVAAFCRMRGHTLVETRDAGGGVTRYVVRNGASQPDASAAAASP